MKQYLDLLQRILSEGEKKDVLCSVFAGHPCQGLLSKFMFSESICDDFGSNRIENTIVNNQDGVSSLFSGLGHLDFFENKKQLETKLPYPVNTIGINILAKVFNKIKDQNQEIKDKKVLEKAFATVSGLTNKEEIVEELHEIIEVNNIDKRIFNGRKAETDFCECITNETTWLLIESCYEDIWHETIHVSKRLIEYLCTFAKAFYEIVEDKFETIDNKISHLHRVATEKLGEMVGCGLRYLQKGISWFRNFCGSAHENEAWNNREEGKFARWCSLKERIKSFLVLALQKRGFALVHIEFD